MINWTSKRINFHRLSFLCIAAAMALLSVSSNASAQLNPFLYKARLSNENIAAGYADQGVYVQMMMGTLYANPCTEQTVEHAMYYGSTDHTRWTVVGVRYGADIGGVCHEGPPGYSGQPFWADMNSIGYHEHYSNISWDPGNWEYVYVERTSSTSCSWNVFFSANLLGTSTSNCFGTGRLVSAGISSTTKGLSTTGGKMGLAQGWMQYWQRKDGNGTWYNGWHGASLSAIAPAKIHFTDSSNTMTEEVLNLEYDF